jgi:hypothetical protein
VPVLLVTYKTGIELEDWNYYTLYIHSSGLQAIQRYRWCTHITVHHYSRTRILSHTVVVSWQRIYNSLTVISNYTWSLNFRAEFFSCHYSAAINSEDSTQLSSSAPKLMSREAGVPILGSSLEAALCCRILLYNDFSRTQPLLLRDLVYGFVA